jgi:hypothetical protein
MPLAYASARCNSPCQRKLICIDLNFAASASVPRASMELRRDDVRHFAGSYVHHLKKTKDGYRIKLQRVDMTNAQAAYDYVLQVWV